MAKSALKLKVIFRKSTLEKMFEKIGMQAEAKIIDLLIRGGEEFDQMARASGAYQNWTGNLRSSIGYAVLKDGAIIRESAFEKVHGAGENSAIVDFNTKSGEKVSFHASGKSGDGSLGQIAGQMLIRKLAKKYPSGYVLLLVAGMNYAICVEAKGYDVASLSFDRTRDYLRRESRKLIRQINKI